MMFPGLYHATLGGLKSPMKIAADSVTLTTATGAAVTGAIPPTTARDHPLALAGLSWERLDDDTIRVTGEGNLTPYFYVGQDIAVDNGTDTPQHGVVESILWADPFFYVSVTVDGAAAFDAGPFTVWIWKQPKYLYLSLENTAGTGDDGGYVRLARTAIAAIGAEAADQDFSVMPFMPMIVNATTMRYASVIRRVGNVALTVTPLENF